MTVCEILMSMGFSTDKRIMNQYIWHAVYYWLGWIAI